MANSRRILCSCSDKGETGSMPSMCPEVAANSFERSTILARSSSFFFRWEMSRAKCTISRRLRRGSSKTIVEMFTHNRLPRLVLTFRSKSGILPCCAAQKLDSAAAAANFRPKCPRPPGLHDKSGFKTSDS